MWFQVLETALTDERVRLLAAQLGISHGDAFLRLCRVWCWLYKQGGRPMTPGEVDVISEHPGFAAAMEFHQLADETPEGLRIRGDGRAKKYGAMCSRQRERAYARHANGMTITNDMPTALPSDMPKAGLISLLGSGSSPESGSGESSQHAIAKARQAETKAKALEAAEAWVEWFNRRFARSFRVTQELSKQVGALLARGYSEKPDMRGVALYLRSRWEDDPKMAVHLVPSTILRSGKFPERLDLAKEWARESGSDIWGSP